MWKRFIKWLNSYDYCIYQLFEDGNTKAFIAVRTSWYFGIKDERYFEQYNEAFAQIKEWSQRKPEYTRFMVYKK
jgi:hypothetical protein